MPYYLIFTGNSAIPISGPLIPTRPESMTRSPETAGEAAEEVEVEAEAVEEAGAEGDTASSTALRNFRILRPEIR